MTQENKEQECKKCGRVFGSVHCFDVDCPNNTPKITISQDKKDLLLEDICSRLPYRVKVKTKDGKNPLPFTPFHLDFYKYNIEDIKPYLFPMSSMTKQQRKEFLEISHLENRSFYNDEEIVIVSNEVWSFDLGGDADIEYRSVNIKRIRETIKWLNKNHFDWRGLIPMGLAEDAAGLNIY